ncbi:MAG: NlpC/P60 family protein [Lachnospiraceae bacterium]|nr:NlpC/P60 family protein [Lachnospiraceae bacterium]
MRRKLNIVMLLMMIIVFVSATPVYASMSLETDAAISGISVALNNYYARNLEPEKALAESVQMVASGIIEINDEKTEKAATKLVKDITPVQETIVTREEGGVTWGTVKDTASLRLRDKPNSSAKTLTLLAKGEHYIVTGQEGQFLKIQVDDDLEGYVFKDYIDTSISYDAELTAEEKAQKESESARLKAEADAAMKALEEAKKAEKNNEKKPETTKAEETKTETTKAEETKETKAEETTVESKAETKEETQESVEKKPETTKAEETKKKEPETIEALQLEENTEKESEADEPYEVEAPETKKEEISSGPGTVTSATRTALVAYAKQFLGNPYVYGGTSLTNGCDCSGFTMQVYKHFGISIPRNSSAQAASGTSINESDAQPGDLYFYDSGGTINHVAIYIGGGQVIHASNSTTGIIISNSHYRTPVRICSYIK